MGRVGGWCGGGRSADGAEYHSVPGCPTNLDNCRGKGLLCL